MSSESVTCFPVMNPARVRDAKFSPIRALHRPFFDAPLICRDGDNGGVYAFRGLFVWFNPHRWRRLCP